MTELRAGRLPRPEQVRVEDFVNAFGYAPGEADAAPVALETALLPCPWAPGQLLLHVDVAAPPRGTEIGPRNLVLAIDDSGSMAHRDREGVVARAVSALVAALDPDDVVSVVAYDRSARVLLPPTPARDAHAIRASLGRLRTSGSTNGGSGLAMAYELATEVDPHHGQVLLFTDGGFNLGATEAGTLRELVRSRAGAGVHLTAIGVRSPKRDRFLDELCRIADGTYVHLQDGGDAHRGLIERLDAVTGVAAADVKVQLFFNPRQIRAWKLVGHVQRRLDHADFNDDRADAAELGYGQRVTALYQLVPTRAAPSGRHVDANPFVAAGDDLDDGPAVQSTADEHMVRVRVRARHPLEDVSQLLERDVDPALDLSNPDRDWAQAMARFALILAEQVPADYRSWEALRAQARAGLGHDRHGRRAEALELMEHARHQQLMTRYSAR